MRTQERCYTLELSLKKKEMDFVYDALINFGGDNSLTNAFRNWGNDRSLRNVPLIITIWELILLRECVYSEICTTGTQDFDWMLDYFDREIEKGKAVEAARKSRLEEVER